MTIKLSDFHKDALREMGNIGAGNAATALSQLLGKDVSLSVPKVLMVPVDKMVDRIEFKNEIVAAVYLKIFGDITGRALMIFPQNKVFLIVDLLMRRALGTTKEFGENEQSALKEIGNILISSYMNAIAKLMGLNSVPSVPALAVDMVEAVFQTVSAEIAETGSEALLIETDMVEETAKIQATVFLIPDEESMRKILTSLDNTASGA
ncbi:MAG: CheY-P-specific phosphatase CheC [Candidatus Goldiibacteriota bacterium HGW-Goldbacteria-1]|jgi:chemotaxis protein CheC|nr:MAG: CheY-P-specific phosphatase CheC [Candidatus Goldiibacteriota bacterium HGW-Goldbacteria-1]